MTHDDHLRDVFHARRARDRRTAPGFTAVLARSPAPHRWRRSVLLAGLATMGVVAAIALGRGGAARDLVPVPVMMAWRPMTDVFLPDGVQP